ncbi:hypothetical protein ZIOFF_030761 [Zingiber officinale]|uniref:Uncharacterized protein n=1 Tax=Zingiber officinale TaxID=94328 RepID=A0A8J5LC06_ZINOF|nr:hypothetical protein ZIOFF_030761 [Zingiber officinale]
MYKPKEEGGFGFQELKSWNLALLDKIQGVERKGFKRCLARRLGVGAGDDEEQRWGISLALFFLPRYNIVDSMMFLATNMVAVTGVIFSLQKFPVRQSRPTLDSAFQRMHHPGAKDAQCKGTTKATTCASPHGSAPLVHAKCQFACLVLDHGLASLEPHTSLYVRNGSTFVAPRTSPFVCLVFGPWLRFFDLGQSLQPCTLPHLCCCFACLAYMPCLHNHHVCSCMAGALDSNLRTGTILHCLCALCTATPESLPSLQDLGLDNPMLPLRCLACLAHMLGPLDCQPYAAASLAAWHVLRTCLTRWVCQVFLPQDLGLDSAPRTVGSLLGMSVHMSGLLDKVKSAQGVRSNSIPIDKKCTSKVHRSIAKANESQAFVNEKILVCSIKDNFPCTAEHYFTLLLSDDSKFFKEFLLARNDADICNAEDYDRVLRGGPFIVFGCPVSKVTPYGVFLLMRGASTVTGLVNWHGRPLFTDQLTRQWGRINYVRVLVKVDITKEPLDILPAILPGGVEGAGAVHNTVMTEPVEANQISELVMKGALQAHTDATAMLDVETQKVGTCCEISYDGVKEKWEVQYKRGGHRKKRQDATLVEKQQL